MLQRAMICSTTAAETPPLREIPAHTFLANDLNKAPQPDQSHPVICLMMKPLATDTNKTPLIHHEAVQELHTSGREEMFVVRRHLVGHFAVVAIITDTEAEALRNVFTPVVDESAAP